MLHLISKILCEDILDHCIYIIKEQENSCLLLYQDAVYFTLQTSKYAHKLQQLSRKHKIYILETDLAARGILGKVLQIKNQIENVNYQQFVELTMQHEKIISW